MSDLPPMRTGFSPLVDDESPPMDADFMRMVVSLMSLLCEEALKSAARFAECCDRRKITGNDTILALKFESHKFWQKDIDARFVANLEEERTHTYETDDSTSDAASSADEDDEDGEFHTTVKTGCEKIELEFYEEVMRIDREWSAWNPTDPVKQLLKRSIESTIARFSVSDDG